MYDDHDIASPHTDPSAGSARKQLIVGSTILVFIMMMTGLALWFVSVAVELQDGSATSESQTVPTEQLLESLASELGPHATPEEFHAAVGSWLDGQVSPLPQLEVALIGVSHRPAD